MREKGIFSFAGNFEVAKTAPLDSKMLVPTFADLTSIDTWKDNKGTVWIYKGMIVSCQDTPGKLYQLTDENNPTDINNWKEINGTSLVIDKDETTTLINNIFNK